MGVSLTLVLYLLPTTIISFIRPDRDWAFIPLVYLGVDVTALFMATCMAFGSMILSMTWLLASPPGYNNSYAACKASVNEGPVAANLTVGAKKPAFTVHHLSDGQCEYVYFEVRGLVCADASALYCPPSAPHGCSASSLRPRSSLSLWRRASLAQTSGTSGVNRCTLSRRLQRRCVQGSGQVSPRPWAVDGPGCRGMAVGSRCRVR